MKVWFGFTVSVCLCCWFLLLILQVLCHCLSHIVIVFVISLFCFCLVTVVLLVWSHRKGTSAFVCCKIDSVVTVLFFWNVQIHQYHFYRAHLWTISLLLHNYTRWSRWKTFVSNLNDLQQKIKCNANYLCKISDGKTSIDHKNKFLLNVELKAVWKAIMKPFTT